MRRASSAPRRASARALLALGLCCALQGVAGAEGDVVIWHSYRAAEERALGQVLERFARTRPGFRVRATAVPHDAFAAKLTAAIPRGHGPDLFIFAHERIGGWVQQGIIQPLPTPPSPTLARQFLPQTLEALASGGRQYGLPLAFKCLALFYNRKLVARPPTSTDELLAFARRMGSGQRGRYALAYATNEFYFHAPWLFGFGGALFDQSGRPRLLSDANVRSFDFVGNLVKQGVIPEEANSALVSRLFNDGSAAMVVDGPWFVGEISDRVDYGIALLPQVSATRLRATPFLTVEGVFVAARARHAGEAQRLASYLAGAQSAQLRARVGRQTVAWASTYDDPQVANDPVLGAYRRQLPHSVLMDKTPAMRSIWEPAKGALMSVLRGADSRAALTRAEHRLRAARRAPARAASPAPYLLGFGLATLGLLLLWLRRRQTTPMRPRDRVAYVYIAPTVAGLVFLAVIPFSVALAISLCRHDGGDFTFIGLANFVDILTSKSYGLSDPLSFYFTLLVTMLWTVANVALHVAIGVALALVLHEPWLRLKGLWRALLIIPWAIPNYITALIWKGMFHKQYGAINELLGLFGIEQVSWFSSFWTAFAANVVTNTWLGFPLMMVVALGALQAIPAELYEAAEVDGAAAWQRLRRITLPLLRPAMLPAVLLGMVWTFNMFNVVYLVSGGEPDGATDILISEAYRWAFQREEQYGYAAAYATLIFCILVAYTLGTRRLAGREEPA